MIEFLERLNVRAEERRVAICVFFGFFIVLNGLWAWRFYAGDTDWSIEKAKFRKESRASKRLNANLIELEQKKDAWEKYEASMGANEDGAHTWTDLHTIVLKLGRENKLSISRTTPSENIDPEFENFEKHTVGLNFSGSDTSLMNYLVALARDPQMVRVSSFTLRPAPRDPKIFNGTISVVASFYNTKKEGGSTPKDKDN
ncbi:MAG: hypothetical protein QF685_08740 [Verrucomicrobiota bacterium]|nr:hypothetical protein [Verrucomicrobiota bacterium]